MRKINEGLMAYILKILSGLSDEEFEKAKKDIKAWGNMKKHLSKGNPQDRMLLQKILKNKKYK